MDETIDCRSEEGITIGLIDALISISRIVNERLHAQYEDQRYLSEPIVEALKDYFGDEDVDAIQNHYWREIDDWGK